MVCHRNSNLPWLSILELAILTFCNPLCLTVDHKSLISEKYFSHTQEEAMLHRDAKKNLVDRFLLGLPLSLLSCLFCSITFQHNCPCFTHAYAMRLWSDPTRANPTRFGELLDSWICRGSWRLALLDRAWKHVSYFNLCPHSLPLICILYNEPLSTRASLTSMDHSSKLIELKEDVMGTHLYQIDQKHR
jgi:hypothetical protein